MKKNLAIFLTTVTISILLIAAIYEFEGGKVQTSGSLESGDQYSETLPIEGISESGETVGLNDELGVSGDVSVSENDSTEQNSSTVNYNNNNAQRLTSNTPYYIKVNNLQNVVTIYSKDSAGNYTVPVKAMVCSTGSATPKAGSAYKITTYKNRWNGLQGNVYGQYATQIVGNILFHSVPYTAKSNSTLEYWEYDKLGTAASLGCIRLTVEDAKWIYDNASSGTIVEFYDDNDPGPLGKPTAQKISDNEEFRNWDPTDPAKENPWNGGSGTKTENTKSENTIPQNTKPQNNGSGNVKPENNSSGNNQSENNSENLKSGDIEWENRTSENSESGNTGIENDNLENMNLEDNKENEKNEDSENTANNTNDIETPDIGKIETQEVEQEMPVWLRID
ncbi:MAG: L,D-transpeptidase [Clostridia bacterium]|nr:L,D-transpeptidase [Clostridia bacterium]